MLLLKQVHLPENKQELPSTSICGLKCHCGNDITLVPIAVELIKLNYAKWHMLLRPPSANILLRITSCKILATLDFP
jgi:hypothetical protein